METGKYTDIHCHILPGVDDGAAGLPESLAMLRCAAAEGIGKIILTPHQKPDRHCVSVKGTGERLETLQRAAGEEGLDLTLYPGAELFYRQGLEEELREGRLCTLAGSRYVLVEFFPQEQFAYIRDGLYSLLAAGHVPVVAHVERFEQLCQSRERLEELLEMGCLYQVNAGSLTGSCGFGRKRMAWRLVREAMVSFVATDAHRAEGSRSVQLSRCAALLEKKCGHSCAEALLYGNAEKILKDEEL